MLVQRKYERPWTREEYPSIRRHPVRVVTWNANDVNTAGIIRTAEAFRIECVYMLRKPKSMAAAVGAHNWQPALYTPNLMEAIEVAREQGFTVVALEQTDASVPLPLAELPERMLLIAGDEGHGVPPKALALTDMAVEIPQYGMVGSLNVTTAVSIALYEWARQHLRR